MKLEQYLVLNRYFHALLGAESLEELNGALYGVQEGIAGDGESYFFKTLVGRKHLHLPPEQLKNYDRRVMAYEERLVDTRGVTFSFRYFQYLALLYTEIFLDALTADPELFCAELNAFLKERRNKEPILSGIEPFTGEDMRRIAFFMATGSGKTLLMHVHLWQILHYLAHGNHPEILVSRSDGRRIFQNILLITPNEGLTRQHLAEFAQSGIRALQLTEAGQQSQSSFEAVKVVDIHKLVEQAAGGGVTIPLESLGSDNLVFVDEGHKGTGSEAQTWKNRQKTLSEDGFLVEYSATFAQAIEAAGASSQINLYSEYGKAILFDYSYRHFYNDGYGKDFRVLNLEQGREQHAHLLLMGGLLIFFQQMDQYESQRDVFRPYNIEAPLWVFIGSSVNAVFTEQRQKQSDVATVVDFLRHTLEDPEWAIRAIGDILNGESGFIDIQTREDLFASHLSDSLRYQRPQDLYERIIRRIFHGRGSLEVMELKNADGELGLRVSMPHGNEHPYFGIISIGDMAAFKKHLQERLGILVKDDNFTPSLFEEINHPNSAINVLIGAKKFIEGWSSWRVSTMGLLNIGKGEGSQVIQLFGRGVRLKGKNFCLRRSSSLPEEGPHPDGVAYLETLYIFGWNADYIQRFHENIQREKVTAQLLASVALMDPWPALPIPLRRKTFDSLQETWILDEHGPDVTLDLTPKLGILTGMISRQARTEGTLVNFSGIMLDMVDLAALYRAVVIYKQRKGYGNLYIPSTILGDILQLRCRAQLPFEDRRNPQRIQEAALALFRTYIDSFVARKEREAESRQVALEILQKDHPNVITQYTLSISDDELFQQIRRVLAQTDQWLVGGMRSLPRIYFDRHLYNPLLYQSTSMNMKISPPGLNPGEAQFIEDLRKLWVNRYLLPPYNEWELYVLRNRPSVGVGFFRRSGFYPDFILWIKEMSSGRFHLIFAEPHGMHHEGLYGENLDKIEALKALTVISKSREFQASNVTLEGYILTQSPKENIPGAEDLSWQRLQLDYKLLQQDREGHYLDILLKMPE